VEENEMPHVRISQPGVMFHLGDEYIPAWNPPDARPELVLPFFLPFLHGTATFHADTFGVFHSGVHNEVFVNGNNIGHLEYGSSDVFETQELDIPTNALRHGHNTLRILAGPGEHGRGPNIDDFLITNIHLHLPG
jgi:hypothetical protein